jgi:hypothetical protein
VVHLLYVLMVVLLCAQAALPVAQGWHQLMEVGVVSAILGLMAWWKRHTTTVLNEDEAILHALEQDASQRRDHPLTPVQARYLVAQARHAIHYPHAHQGERMDTVISLGTPNLDWAVLARVVERTNTPVWLELDGTIQGVLLPTSEAHRLLGQYTQRRSICAGVETLLLPADQP